MSLKVAFVCTGNIVRSQMAEGLARHLSGGRFEVFSAGVNPNPRGLHPYAVRVMSERGIDISEQRPKGLDAIPLGEMDYVITVCGDADRSCPVLPARIRRFHWPIPDPGLFNGSEDEKIEFFRSIRNDMETRMRDFISRLPIFSAVARETI